MAFINTLLSFRSRKLELEKEFSNKIEIKKILTSGDKNQKDRLSNLGGKGLFCTKIENELINNEIDIAVHALKDMPSIETKELTTNFFLKRNSNHLHFLLFPYLELRQIFYLD